MKNSHIWVVFLFILIITYWVTFIEKVGLHGDEAYFGLTAIDFLKNGISRPYGMNKYTGILQSLSNMLFFKLIGIKVAAMRIGGIVSNIASLGIIVFLLKKRVNNHAALFFLLLVLQSALMLIYPKIGWEVCSFNYLFIALSLLSLHKMDTKNAMVQNIMLFVFLLSTLMGVYNHILFSSYIVAVVLGLSIWIVAEKKTDKNVSKYLLLFSISLLNAIVLHLVMSNSINILWKYFGLLVFVFPLILIVAELFVFKKIVPMAERVLAFLSGTKIKKPVFMVVLLFFLIEFGLGHLATQFQILSNERVFLRIFSYEINPFFKFYFILTAVCLLAFIVVCFVTDVRRSSEYPWTYILIVYLGIFKAYTKVSSIRYFLILTILILLFLCFKLSHESAKVRAFFIVLLAVGSVFMQTALWNINFDNNRRVMARNFNLGINQKETSAHFLNFTPVINYACKNNIGVIETQDTFFIGNVFEFYKNVYPGIKNFKDTATVNYDYTTEGIGFDIQ